MNTIKVILKDKENNEQNLNFTPNLIGGYSCSISKELMEKLLEHNNKTLILEIVNV